MIFQWMWDFFMRWAEGLVTWLTNVFPDVPSWWVTALAGIVTIMHTASLLGHWMALDTFGQGVMFVVSAWWIVYLVRLIVFIIDVVRGSGA